MKKEYKEYVIERTKRDIQKSLFLYGGNRVYNEYMNCDYEDLSEDEKELTWPRSDYLKIEDESGKRALLLTADSCEEVDPEKIEVKCQKSKRMFINGHHSISFSGENSVKIGTQNGYLWGHGQEYTIKEGIHLDPNDGGAWVS